MHQRKTLNPSKRVKKSLSDKALQLFDGESKRNMQMFSRCGTSKPGGLESTGLGGGWVVTCMKHGNPPAPRPK